MTTCAETPEASIRTPIGETNGTSRRLFQPRVENAWSLKPFRQFMRAPHKRLPTPNTTVTCLAPFCTDDFARFPRAEINSDTATHAPSASLQTQRYDLFTSASFLSNVAVHGCVTDNFKCCAIDHLIQYKQIICVGCSTALRRILSCNPFCVPGETISAKASQRMEVNSLEMDIGCCRRRMNQARTDWPVLSSPFTLVQM